MEVRYATFFLTRSVSEGGSSVPFVVTGPYAVKLEPMQNPHNH
jgi:hypothetical protein